VPPAPPASSPAAPVWLLNAPILTAEGLFRCRTMVLDEARALVAAQGFESAIGHALTAAVLSDLLAIDCPVRRVEFQQAQGQLAIVFRLARRIEEGRVLHDRAEIEKVGYSFLLLTREE
jgi:hypothetical protein